MDWSGALPTSTSRFVGATIRAAAETEAIEGGAIAVVIIIALLAVATVFWAETKGAANEAGKGGAPVATQPPQNQAHSYLPAMY